MAGKHAGPSMGAQRRVEAKAKVHATLGLQTPVSTQVAQATAKTHLSGQQMGEHAESDNRDKHPLGYNSKITAPKPAGPQHETPKKRPDSKPYANAKYSGKHRVDAADRTISSGDTGRHAKAYSPETDIAQIHSKRKNEYVGSHRKVEPVKNARVKGAVGTAVKLADHVAGKLARGSKHAGRNKEHLKRMVG